MLFQLDLQNHKYPISFNGKMRFVLELPTTLTKPEIEKEVLKAQQTEKYIQTMKYYEKLWSYTLQIKSTRKHNENF